MHPPSHVETSLPSPDGNDPTAMEPVLSNGVSFSDSESELSEPADPPMASASSSPQEKSENVANHANHSGSEEEDAAGSEDDDDYNMDLSMQPVRDEGSSQRSSSDESLRPHKRKATTTAVDDEEYIRNNPDLYGLRRSHRARPSRPMLDDSTDQNDSDSDVAVRPRKRLRQSSRQSSKQATPMPTD